MAVETVIDTSLWDGVDVEALALTAIHTVLTRFDLPMERAEICVLATDDANIAKMNAAFRGKAKPTNVLSWPAQELAPDAPGGTPPGPQPDPMGDLPLGDIAIAYETCAHEAQAADKPISDHVTHLLIHGTLHLLGFDHENDADAHHMEQTEIDILAGLGVENPYIIADGSTRPEFG